MVTIAIVLSLLAVLLLGAEAGAESEESRPGWFGFGFSYHRSEANGWLVVEVVTPGGPASEAGVQMQDVITAVDGKALVYEGPLGVLELFASFPPDEPVRLEVVRGSTKREMTVVPVSMTDEQFAVWQENMKIAKMLAGRRNEDKKESD